MDLSGLNRQMSAVNPQYSARFVPAPDESVDDEIEILLAGAKTRWGIQIGDGDFVVSEYGFDANGELAPYPSDDMICWPVSARVGNVRNNDSSLIEPVAAA